MKPALRGKGIKTSAFKDRHVLEVLDWKKSIYYRNILGEVDDKLSWHLNDDLLKQEELDHLVKLIGSFKQKKAIFQQDELAVILNTSVKRAYKTIEYLHRELLQEQYYALELD